MVHEDGLTDDLVRQMHVSLASALRRARPDPFGAPVTVAEIYQDLIPYRAVRRRLGLEMNADYEHTLLRLLAGESGLARLEPREARRELEAEAASANPNVGLFRKFAACDVWITATDAVESEESPRLAESTHAPTPAGPSIGPPEDELPLLGVDLMEDLLELDSVEAPLAGSAPSQAPHDESLPLLENPKSTGMDDTWDTAIAAAAARASAERAEQESAHEDVLQPEAVPTEPEQTMDVDTAEDPIELEFDAELLLEDEVVDTATVEGGIVEGRPEPAPEPLEKPMPEPSAVRPSAEPKGSCAFCNTALPGGRAVKYCPFCGADQSMRPCGSCGEPLEQAWRFCIACGATSPVAMAATT